MNILFLTLLDFSSFSERNIYCDLLREFIKNGHDVYCISPSERRTGKNTHLTENSRMLKPKIGNMQKTNIIEKGISTLTVGHSFISAVKKYFGNVKFDMVLYSTPPITLCRAVRFVKKRDGAKTYLLLKDIFPQNAADLGMMSKTGIKSFIYRYFRKKEKELYRISDKIGCMSEANVRFLLQNNPEISGGRVTVCPNSIEPEYMQKDAETRVAVRKKYGIPEERTIFIYGGNLGRPQGIPFVEKCLCAVRTRKNAFFLIVGSGTEYGALRRFFDEEKPENAALLPALPRADFENLTAVCDVGMIFLDSRFTVPNFPSRLLSYMQARIPVLSCTDKNTDIGDVITAGNFGISCESDDENKFAAAVDAFLAMSENEIKALGENAFAYLEKNYTAEKSYEIIMRG